MLPLTRNQYDALTIEAKKCKHDVYKHIAAYLYQVKYEAVTKEQRGYVKEFCFCYNYGGKPRKIAAILDQGQQASPVNHPSHYGGAENPYEHIKVMGAWLSREALSGYLLGNCTKYIARAGKKVIVGDSSTQKLEDLRKAAWYLDYETRLLEKEKEAKK